VVTRTELRRTIRSPRTLVLLILFAVFTAVTGLLGGAITRGVESQGPEAAAAAGASLIALFFGGDPSLLAQLSDLPLLLPLVFGACLFFLPLYVVLLGYDQLSAEVASGSVRHLAVRARRGSILGGKFLAQAVVTLTVLALVVLALFAAGARLRPVVEPVGYLTFGLRFWIGGALLACAYVALTSLSSAVTASPAASLLLNLSLLFAFWLLKVMAGASSTTEVLRWLSPLTYLGGVFVSGPPYATSLTAYVCFAALFLAGAWAAFRIRDI